MLDVGAIDPSSENRRADVDLAPLVESVRTYGMQMPIKVRPKGDRFEIVFGEGRWRAAKELGLSTIPATVEDLTDEEAQARRILENTQRRDPHALEEAESYERLLAMRDRKGKARHTPESIAQVAGRSPAHVYSRLKLTAFAPELRKAFYAEELTLTAAFLIARGIPTGLQVEAWARFKRYAEEAYEDELDDAGRLRTRAIEAVIQRDYAFRLDGDPFPIDDATLVAIGTPPIAVATGLESNRRRTLGGRPLCAISAAPQARGRAYAEAPRRIAGSRSGCVRRYRVRVGRLPPSRPAGGNRSMVRRARAGIGNRCRPLSCSE
jgi:ParB family transcriptional regulator, chromosome partitioning protein